MKTEFKGTKGNWKLKEGRDNLIISEENFHIATTWVAGIGNIPQEANAKLIASAPELLETVLELHKLLEENLPNWYLKRHDNIVKNVLEKALT